MVEKNKGFQVGAHIVMIILSLCCIFPFLLLIVSSITDEQELIRNGYTLFPKALSLNAYQYMFKSSNKIISAYGITILSTVVGTVCGLSMTILMAYPLSCRAATVLRSTCSSQCCSPAVLCRRTSCTPVTSR